MSKVHASTHPLVQHKLTILRDKNTGPRKFRELAREISALLTYEATADLETETRNVETPMGKAKGSATKDNIGLYRDEKTLQPVQYYNKLPTLPTVGACLVLDPMLATGGSATATVSLLKEWGVKNIRYVGIIGAPEGIELLSKTHPDVPIYLGAVDSHLNEIGYIVPGLGDAGDRQFGTG